MSEQAGVDERLAREREFHDRVFSANSRAPTWKYYAAASGAKHYEQALASLAPGLRVLDFGCGRSAYGLKLAQSGLRVTGIDISPVAVEEARQAAREQGLDDHARFEVMNAEQLSFADGSFDVVCGSSILHHLELERAYAEVARVLAPDGSALFVEALGHNPVINAFRRRTPHFRSQDEHPLLERDLRLAESYFESVEPRFFDLSTLASVPLRDRRAFERVHAALTRLDERLFARLPALRKHAWMVVLVLSGPRPA